MAEGSLMEILLVEDNAGDVRLTQEMFKECPVPNVLHIVRDGEEAMTFLKRQGLHAEARRPDLVLLDLNLPKKDGRAVLAEVKSDPELKRVPIVILTTSKAEDDVFEAYNLHANCYIIKPVDLNQFLTVVHRLGDFWLGLVELPPK